MARRKRNRVTDWTPRSPIRGDTGRPGRARGGSGTKKNPPVIAEGRVEPGKLRFSVSTPPGFSYTTKAEKPCPTDRKTCPVQVFFDNGTPYLRFCRAKNQPGHKVEFKSAKAAQKAAQKACKCWFDSARTPSKRSFDKCDVSRYGLGGTTSSRGRGAKRSRRRSKPKGKGG